MTTYQYTISLDDSEFIILERILKERVEHLKLNDDAYKKIAEMGHLFTEEVILEKMKQSCSSAVMMSTSSFCTEGVEKLWSPSNNKNNE